MSTHALPNASIRRHVWIMSLLVLGAAVASLSNDVKAIGGGGTVLYDASGPGAVLPSAAPWGWAYGATNCVACNSMDGGSTILDSSTAARAGYNKTVAGGLSSAGGFSLDFALRIASESHMNTDRSGTSIIVLDNAAQGVELSFWTNEVWAKNANSAFSHDTAESIVVNTTQFERTYSITFLGGNYSLSIDGTPAFGGSVRDYAASASFPASVVYSTPNYIFFGDNTTSAGGRVALSYVALNPVPEPGTWAMMLGGLALVGWAGRRRLR